ncbi:MAG: universal stress protein, partial [Selenomonas sp.]|nr:universal stress protein [Selenomonas sp.]
MPGGKLARILVPIDASEGAGRAAAFAVNLAEITGADVDVLHVTYFDKDTDAKEESWLPDSIAGSMDDEA